MLRRYPSATSEHQWLGRSKLLFSRDRVGGVGLASAATCFGRSSSAWIRADRLKIPRTASWTIRATGSWCFCRDATSMASPATARLPARLVPRDQGRSGAGAPHLFRRLAWGGRVGQSDDRPQVIHPDTHRQMIGEPTMRCWPASSTRSSRSNLPGRSSETRALAVQRPSSEGLGVRCG